MNGLYYNPLYTVIYIKLKSDWFILFPVVVIADTNEWNFYKGEKTLDTGSSNSEHLVTLQRQEFLIVCHNTHIRVPITSTQKGSTTLYMRLKQPV